MLLPAHTGVELRGSPDALSWAAYERAVTSGGPRPRRRPFRPVADGLPAPGQRPHGPLQLHLRAPAAAGRSSCASKTPTSRAPPTRRSRRSSARCARWGWTGTKAPSVPGPHGPYRQTERQPIYHEYVERLLASGHLYPCFCTAEELEAERQRGAGREARLGVLGHVPRAPRGRGRAPQGRRRAVHAAHAGAAGQDRLRRPAARPGGVRQRHHRRLHRAAQRRHHHVQPRRGGRRRDHGDHARDPRRRPHQQHAQAGRRSTRRSARPCRSSCTCRCSSAPTRRSSASATARPSSSSSRRWAISWRSCATTSAFSAPSSTRA